MKKSIAISVILLFILSTVGSMAVNNNITYSMKQSIYESYLLEDYYDCYSLDEIPENIRPIISNEEENQDTPETENAFCKIDSPELLNGLMDSPWPIYCHDTRHTGRSPYSTIDNHGVENWRFDTGDESAQGGVAIDDEGTLYIGANGIYAVYPDGTLKWKFITIFSIFMTPAIDENGIIYFGPVVGNEYLYALHTSNGTLKWKYWVGDSLFSSPAIGTDGIIYFGDANNNINALYPNGTLKWRYSTDHVVYSSPAIGDDGTIYCGSHDQYLHALYSNNGTLKWKYKTGHWIRTSPCIGADGTIYVVSLDYYLHAVNPNGTLKWKKNVGAGTSPTIGQDGTIYAGYRLLHAINPNGSVKWIFNPGSDRMIRGATPCNSVDGTIYFGTHIGETTGGEVIAVDPNGTEKWRLMIAWDWVDSAPAIGEDGTLYVGSCNDGYHPGSWGYLHSISVGKVTANANGPYYKLINQPIQFTGTSSGGYLPHTFHWDFGDTHTSEEQNPIYTYTNPGNYTVVFTVTDNKSNTITDTTYAWIQTTNSAPDKPMINGPINGLIGITYDYTFSTTDPDNSIIYQYVDWGDTSNTGWLGPYDSGQQVTLCHSWTEQDTYTIKAQAKDPYDAEGPWETFDVTMPKNKMMMPSPFWNRLLERFLKLEWIFTLLG